MVEVRYVSTDQQRETLRQLAEAIPLFVEQLNRRAEFRHEVPAFLEWCSEARRLQGVQFSQDDLTRLANAIRPLIKTNPHWTPPLEEVDGRFILPSWYPGFEEAHERVVVLASKLRVIGEY